MPANILALSFGLCVLLACAVMRSTPPKLLHTSSMNCVAGRQLATLTVQPRQAGNAQRAYHKHPQSNTGFFAGKPRKMIHVKTIHQTKQKITSHFCWTSSVPIRRGKHIKEDIRRPPCKGEGPELGWMILLFQRASFVGRTAKCVHSIYRMLAAAQNSQGESCNMTTQDHARSYAQKLHTVPELAKMSILKILEGQGGKPKKIMPSKGYLAKRAFMDTHCNLTLSRMLHELKLSIDMDP